MINLLPSERKLWIEDFSLATSIFDSKSVPPVCASLGGSQAMPLVTTAAVSTPSPANNSTKCSGEVPGWGSRRGLKGFARDLI